MTEPTRWTDYTPQEAKDQKLDLRVRTDITAPLNENGERCPWPWEPEQLGGAPMGQYRCPYCNAMVMAGMPHLDYAPQTYVLTEDNWGEVAEKLRGETFQERPGVLMLPTPWEPEWAALGDTIHVDGYGVVSTRRLPARATEAACHECD